MTSELRVLHVVVVDDVSSMREGLRDQFNRLPHVAAEDLTFEQAMDRADWLDVDWVVSDAAFDLRERPEFEGCEPTPAVPLIRRIRGQAESLRPRIVVVTSCPATWNEPVVRRRIAEVDPNAHYLERAEFQRQLDVLLAAVESASMTGNDFATELGRLLTGLRPVGDPTSIEDLGITAGTRLNALLDELRERLSDVSRMPRRAQDRARIEIAARHGLEAVRRDGSVPRKSQIPRLDHLYRLVRRSRALPHVVLERMQHR